MNAPPFRDSCDLGPTDYRRAIPFLWASTMTAMRDLMNQAFHVVRNVQPALERLLHQLYLMIECIKMIVRAIEQAAIDTCQACVSQAQER